MAALGGAADQITKDIETQENEVKLRTRTILDRHVAETAANRKEYKANKKKVQEQLNSIVSYFGDDPDRWNKARAIVAGGDAHVAKMSQYFAGAQKNKQNVNEIYTLTKSENDVGLKGIEDTTNSLVQMAQIAQPSFGKKGETASAFGLDMGTTMYRNMYAKGRKQYVESGLLDAVPTATETGATYGSGNLDLSKINTDAKSVDQQKANILSALTNNEVGTAEHNAALKKQSILNSFEESNSLALKIAKEQNKTKGNATRSFYMTTLKNGLLGIENKFKDPLVKGLDGKTIEDPAKKSEFKEQSILKYKTDFVNNLIRNPGGLSSNGLDVIQGDPQLNEIYKNIMEAEQDKISGGGDTSTTPKVKTQQEKFDEVKIEFPNAPDFISNAVNSDKDLNKIFKLVQQIYGVDSKIAQQLISQAQKNKPKKKDYGSFVDLTKPAPQRPSGGFFTDSDEEKKAMAEWDKKYGATHNEDGSLKK